MTWYQKMAKQWSRIFGEEKSETEFDEITEADLLTKLESTKSLGEQNSLFESEKSALITEKNSLAEELKSEKEKVSVLETKILEHQENEKKLSEQISSYESKFEEMNKKFEGVAKELNDLKTIGVKSKGEGNDFKKDSKSKEPIQIDWTAGRKSSTRSYFG
jgi:chromosome segregation ATPase